MFQRIANGWELARQSWEVLKLDKELLLFPLMSGIACLIVLASFAIPLWSTQFIDVVKRYPGSEHVVGRASTPIGVVGVPANRRAGW